MTTDIDAVTSMLHAHIGAYEAWNSDPTVALILNTDDGYRVLESKVLTSVLQQIRTANPDIPGVGPYLAHMAKMLAKMNDIDPQLPWFPHYASGEPMIDVFVGIVLISEAWVVHGDAATDRDALPADLGDYAGSQEIVQASAHVQGDGKIMVVRYRDGSRDPMAIRSDVHGVDALEGEVPDALKRVFRHVRAHIHMHPFPSSPVSKHSIITAAGKLADELDSQRLDGKEQRGGR